MADDKQNYTKTGIDQSHDIVTRLRQYVLWLPNTAAGEVCREAADEIERLRAIAEFATHDDGCDQPMYAFQRVCTCGLTELLEEARRG